MSYRGDPNVHEPPPEDLEAFERIKANPLPLLGEGYYQVIKRKKRTLYHDGSYADITTTEIRGGDPELLVIENDLCDSAWFYPLIKTEIFPVVEKKVVNHAEWHRVRKLTRRPDVAIKLFRDQYSIEKLNLSIGELED